MDPELTFRWLRPNEMETGYAILLEAFAWLQCQRIRQWVSPTPRQVYAEWQDKRWNYGLFVWDELAVILSLVEGPLAEWSGVADDETVLWLHALATASQFKGRELGRRAMLYALEIANARMRDLYLTCVVGDGFLPDFYESLGFRPLHREIKQYGEVGSFDMLLMRYSMWEI